MNTTAAVWIVIGLAFGAANLPWLSERIFFLFSAGERGKSAWWRWAEWVALYFVAGAVALGVEKKLNGTLYQQDWEFFAVTACLFLVFALPGFIYRHDLKQHLRLRRA